MAMVGKNCFAIASDRRLGVQLQTIATDAQTLWVSRILDWFGSGASIRGAGVGRAWFRVWV